MLESRHDMGPTGQLRFTQEQYTLNENKSATLTMNRIGKFLWGQSLSSSKPLVVTLMNLPRVGRLEDVAIYPRVIHTHSHF